MKSVIDYIRLCEDTAATNTISGGAIATKEVPLGTMAKRKKPLNEGELCPHCGTDHNDNATPAKISVDGVVPLSTAYADGCYLPSKQDIEHKRKSDME